MRISGITYLRYRIPFRVPITTSRGVEEVREGFIVEVTTDSGLRGLGEAAPLHSFGTGKVDDSEHHLNAIAPRIRGTCVDEIHNVLDSLGNDPTSAPVRFALDTAALDVRSQYAGIPLSRYLDPHAASEVPVNATIGNADVASAVEAAMIAVTDGFPTMKLKVGVAGNLRDEVARVAAVRNAVGPDIELRLDANGAWSYEQAITMARALEQFDISYIEQPLPSGDLTGLARLRRSIGIRIAADESATTIEAIREIIRHEAADVLIIKPGVIGEIWALRKVISLAHQAGLQVVVTTSIETGIGTAASLHLAATLPKPIPPCGLAAGNLLESDLLAKPLEVQRGRMLVPGTPGLGVKAPAQPGSFTEH